MGRATESRRFRSRRQAAPGRCVGSWLHPSIVPGVRPGQLPRFAAVPYDAAVLTPDLAMIGASLAGIGFGLWLLLRGFGSRLQAARIADTATSSIGSIALGEVRVSGIVEPAEVLLASPLQDEGCVYYRAQVHGGARTDPSGRGSPFDEQRAVGFRVRDASGSLRVFPRSARWDVPDRYDEADTVLGGRPPGLRPRTGSTYRAAVADREQQIAALLTVRQPEAATPWTGADSAWFETDGRRRTRYREARVEPGDVVTVLGRVVRFADLPDPAWADTDAAMGGEQIGPQDPVIAKARAAGLLESDPARAWGNAAIPGFGIGRPLRRPELDPGVAVPALATADEESGFEQVFDLSPDRLILAADADVPLVVALGTPGVVARRHEDRFAVGLLGAVLAIASAVLLALTVRGAIGA